MLNMDKVVRDRAVIGEVAVRKVEEHDLDLWKDSGDEMLMQLREDYIQRGYVPDVKEAENTLTFFCVFSIGFGSMGIGYQHTEDTDAAANRFARRADLYITGLHAMGYKMQHRSVYTNPHIHLTKIQVIERSVRATLEHRMSFTARRVKKMDMKPTKEK